MTLDPGIEPRPHTLQAVLFDMDGLLIDSEPQWLAAETATVEQLGGVWGARQNKELHGTNLPVAADYMIRHTASALTRSEVMALLANNFARELARGVSFQAGALELLHELVDSEIKTGLVTSSIREHVDLVLQQLPDAVFDVTVTADDVTQLKPHPMPYQTAIASLGVDPRTTIVLEDSPPGVASGEAAGCHVVAVPTSSTITPGAQRTVLTSLTDLTVERLRELPLE